MEQLIVHEFSIQPYIFLKRNFHTINLVSKPT